MLVSSWNVRGLHDPRKSRSIKAMLIEVKPSLMLLQETKMSSSELSKICKKFWYKCSWLTQDSVGQSGGFAILWDSRSLECSLAFSSIFWMAVVTKCLSTGKSFYLINVYGPQDEALKQVCWSEITNWIASQTLLPCIIEGLMKKREVLHLWIHAQCGLTSLLKKSISLNLSTQMENSLGAIDNQGIGKTWQILGVSFMAWAGYSLPNRGGPLCRFWPLAHCYYIGPWGEEERLPIPIRKNVDQWPQFCGLCSAMVAGRHSVLWNPNVHFCLQAQLS